MRILVVGAGAIGSVLGGFLAKAGHSVTLFGRPWHLDAIRRHGLAITGLWGEHKITKLTCATCPEEVKPTKDFDWIFICVKSHQTPAAAALLKPWIGPSTLVCAFQNGVGNEKILRSAVPVERLALARIIFGVELSPGSARVTVCADETLIGVPSMGGPKEEVVKLAAAIDEAGIPARATATILSALWTKVLYNCALNGLSTLFEVPYGRLPEYPVARRLMQAVVEEVYAVAEAQGRVLEPADAKTYLEMLFGRLIPDTAAHRPSMLQDIRRGRPTEIDAMNGAIGRMGKELGKSVPANTLITRLVHLKEKFTGIGSDD